MTRIEFSTNVSYNSILIHVKIYLRISCLNVQVKRIFGAINILAVIITDKNSFRIWRYNNITYEEKQIEINTLITNYKLVLVLKIR